MLNFIKKIYWRLRYNRRYLIGFIATLLLLTLLVVGGGAFYFVFYKVFDDVERVQFLRSRPYLIKALPILRTVRKISDILYLPYYFKKSELPVYELYIDPADIKKMDESLPPPFTEEIYTNKKYVPAKFIADNKEYKVDVRYRGDNSIHWEADKKSYLIRFDKDNLFNGFRRLSFIIADDRKFVVEQLNNYRANKLNLYYPPSSFAVLKINGQSNGLYFMIENWGPEMLAKWQMPDSANLYGGADPVVWFNRLVVDNIWDTLGVWDKKSQDTLLPYSNFSEVDKLLDLVNNTSDEVFAQSVFDLIDRDNFFNWLVHQNLVSSAHQGGPNLRLYFNNALGKFIFIPWDVDNFPFNQIIDTKYHQLVDRVLANPQYLYERNKRLWRYVDDKDNLRDDLDFYDQTYKQIKPALYQDRMKIYTNRWADNLIQKRRALMVENFEGIKETLKKQRAFIEIRVDLNQAYSQSYRQRVLAIFDIKVDNVSELLLENLTIPLNNNPKPSEGYLLYYDKNYNNLLDSEDELLTEIGLNPDNDKELVGQNSINTLLFTNREIEDVSLFQPYQLILTSHRFFLVSQSKNSRISDWQLDKIKFNIINAITEKKLKNIDMTKSIVNEKVFANFFDINENIDDFLSRYSFFAINKNKKELILKNGSYNINQTIIIPKDFSLRIELGTTLYFAPEISLISYSPVLAQGTINRPIKFIGQNKTKPWGVFGVLGPHNRESIFEHCLFEGGGDAYINGVFYSGQLAVHYADAIIKNCQFKFASGDDGLNVKKGKVEIKNNYFYKNKFDGLDLDWTNGIVSGNYFLDNGQADLNGDGLDLCGVENLVIFNNRVKNSSDKCLSIGENSKKNTVIFNNLFSGCQMGVAIKDNSEVILLNNTIVNNKTGIAVYEKKPVFGGALPTVVNTIIWHNEKSIETDGKSKINISYSDVQGGYQGENNFNQEPIFQNPEQDHYLLLDNQENSVLIKGGHIEILKTILNKQLEIVPVGLITSPPKFYD